MVSGPPCMSKFNGMKRTFKAISDHNSKSGNHPASWPYFELKQVKFGELPFVERLSVDSEMKLTERDIISIADTSYDWSVGDSKGQIFYTGNTNNFLSKCTSQLIVKNMKPFVYMLLLESSHWAPLVIVYRDKQFFGYFIHPLGEEVPNEIKEHLKNSKIHCPNITVRQPNLDTGIFALKCLDVILKQRQSFSMGMKAELKKMKPSKNGQRLKNEIEKNGKYKKVDYNDLDNQLGSLCSQLNIDKNGGATFIISDAENCGSSNNQFIILTFGFRDEQVVACCVTNSQTYKDIKSLLSKKGIVLIFAKDISKVPKFNNYNIELLPLQIAKVVTNYFKNRDYTTLAEKELKKAVPKEVVKRVINSLKARKKMVNKFVRFLSVNGKYIIHYGPRLTREDFSVAQCNILVLFLESTALQDKELSSHLGETLKRFRTRIMGDEDYKVINIIRSEILLHRSSENKYTIIKLKDINKFVRNDISKLDFFKLLQSYVKQKMDLLNRNTEETRPEVDSFFKSEEEIRNISFKVKTEKEIRCYLSHKFLKLVKNSNPYSSKDRQHTMFQVVVNIIPLLESLYSDIKKNEDKKLEIKELRDIQERKNEVVHNFIKYKSEKDRMSKFTEFIDKIKPTFFKYIYSEKVYELLYRSTLPKDTIELTLKILLSDLLTYFGNKPVFNNVEEAFNDETFLSFLTCRKVILRKRHLSNPQSTGLLPGHLLSPLVTFLKQSHFKEDILSWAKILHLY